MNHLYYRNQFPKFEYINLRPNTMKIVKTLYIYSSIVLFLFTIVQFGCKKQAEDDSNLSTIVSDIDGNVYKTVTIGNQTWMAENLKVTKFRNGDIITNANTSWSQLTNGAFCWYNNDIKYKSIYGALYNWYAIIDTRNIAPDGWHVATNEDWIILTTFLGGENIAGGKLKGKGVSFWKTPNTGASDQYGFNALPGGMTITDILFDGEGIEGVWWSYTKDLPTDYSNDWFRQMWFDEETVSNSGLLFEKGRGLSVRCVKDNNNQILTIPTVKISAVINIASTSATSGGEVTSDGGSPVIARGVCWSTSPLPTIADNKTNDGTGKGVFTSSITGLSPGISYYVRAYATNSKGTIYDAPVKFVTPIAGVVSDVDGNAYQTITIGNQVWMVENLKVTKFRNGDVIPNGESDWMKLSVGAYCWYNNDIKNKDIYGALYSWFAIKDYRNIAPVGWHVATNEDWQILTTYLGGTALAGGILKEKGTIHWKNPNLAAIDQYGFKALPGGCYFGQSKEFISIGIEGIWWSNVPFHAAGTNDWNRQMYSNSAAISKSVYSSATSMGHSVRCVKGEIYQNITVPNVTTVAVTYISSSTVLAGGNVISDGGSSLVTSGVCWSTSPLPTIVDSKTDNGYVNKISNFITSLKPGTKYYLRAYATNGYGTGYGAQEIFTTTNTIDGLFATQLIPLFSIKCVACHRSGGESPDLSSTSTYSNIINKNLVNIAIPTISKIYSVPNPTNTTTHSWKKYTTDEAALVLKWIQQGAKNN